MIPFENEVRISKKELSFEEIKEKLHHSQRNSKYFSPSAAKIMIGEAFIKEQDGFDYDFKADELY